MADGWSMGVLQGEANWPGDPMGLALTAAGRSDLRARLAKDVSDLRQQASESARGDYLDFVTDIVFRTAAYGAVGLIAAAEDAQRAVDAAGRTRVQATVQ